MKRDIYIDCIDEEGFEIIRAIPLEARVLFKQQIRFPGVKDLQKPVYVMYVTVCPPAGLYFCSALINTSA